MDDGHAPSLTKAEQVSAIAGAGAAGQNVAEGGEAGAASGVERNGSRAGDGSEVEPSAGSSGFSYSRWDKVWRGREEQDEREGHRVGKQTVSERGEANMRGRGRGRARNCKRKRARATGSTREATSEEAMEKARGRDRSKGAR